MLRSVAIALALSVAGCQHAPAPPGEVAATRLVVLHTNDTHGKIWGEHGVGDASRRAGLVAAARAEAAEAGGVVLLLDAGDVRTGSYCSDRHQALPDFEVMGAMGYDAMTLGNHELDVPLETTLEQRSAMGFPLLGANLVAPDRDEPILEPFVVIERGGLRLAVLGLVTPETRTGSTFGSLAAARFADPVATARRLVPELRARADVVIALSHNGLDEDRALARAVPGIDVVVGGHSHSVVEAPVRAGGAIIVQAGSDGRFLGRLDLEVGPGGVRLLGGRLVPVTPDLPSDPAVAEILRRRDCPEAREVVGRAAERIGRGPVAGPGTSSPLGNLVGRAIREVSGAELSLTNRGGLRADLAEGEVTLGEIHAVLPFTNTLVVLGATGEDLVALARSAARRGPSGSGFLLPGGMDWVLRADGEASVEVGGEPVDPARTYRLVVSSFLAEGGDGYEEMTRLPRLEALDATPREALSDHIRRAGVVVADRTTSIRWEPARSPEGEALAPPGRGPGPSSSDLPNFEEKGLTRALLVSSDR